MKERDLLALRKALKPLLKDDWAKGCKTFCFMCAACMPARVIEEFNSLVNDVIESDEAQTAYWKKFKEAEKKAKKKEWKISKPVKVEFYEEDKKGNWKPKFFTKAKK